MSQASEINTLVTTANTYIAAENWASAEITLMQVQTLMASVPRSQFDGQMLEYRDTINNLLDRVRKKANRTVGVQRTTLSMAPVLEQDDFT